MPAHVLLIEDNPGDAQLTQEAFREANMHIQLHLVSDGVDALKFLRREGANLSAPRPDLILLDLSLPKLDGEEALSEIKTDESLRMIPVLILTISQAETDVLKSYQLHASCYLSKPVGWDAFARLRKNINDFWLVKTKLPEQRTSLAPRPRGRGQNIIEN
jgi:chemotaxis family two-component system response regulator Rcp1